MLALFEHLSLSRLSILGLGVRVNKPFLAHFKPAFIALVLVLKPIYYLIQFVFFNLPLLNHFGSHNELLLSFALHPLYFPFIEKSSLVCIWESFSSPEKEFSGDSKAMSSGRSN